MKSVSIVVATILSTLLFSSCIPNFKNEGKSVAEADLKPIVINNEYSMVIPGFMSKTNSLNEEASLQFQNMFKEAYVIVIDEDKQEFIDTYLSLEAYDSAVSAVTNYAETQIQLTTSNLDVLSRNEKSALTINGLQAEAVEFDASVEGVKAPITYFLTFIESKTKLYMVMAWTLQNRKDTHRETFDKMARSFKTIETTPVAAK